MTTILIAVNDPRRPTVSAILCGPEVQPDEARKRLAAYRASGTNPTGLPWVQLWSVEAPQVAHTPNNPAPKGKTK